MPSWGERFSKGASPDTDAYRDTRLAPNRAHAHEGREVTCRCKLQQRTLRRPLPHWQMAQTYRFMPRPEGCREREQSSGAE
jgi:hypothetical protein